MSDFELNGGEELARLSKALRDAGRKEIRRDLNKALRQAVTPLIGDTRIEAQRRLPKRGGLAKRVAEAPQRVQVRTGREMGVRIVVGGKKTGAKATDDGVIRHPVFGNREIWVAQKVPPGWFTDPMKAAASSVTPDLERAMESTLDRIVSEVE